MASGNEDQMIANFTEVTGIDTERGRFYLEASGWNLDSALASFYEEQEHDPEPSGMMMREDSDTEADSRHSEAMQSLLSSLRQAPQVAIPPALASLGSAPAGFRQAKVSRTTRPGQPATLDSLRQQQESGGESSDEDQRRQEFYAGGSESSGQQVLGPPKKRDELVAEMFKKAREHGAEEVVGSSSSTGGQRGMAGFGGTGYKLGEGADDHVTIPGAASTSSEPQDVVLRLWSKGFTVNDGPLRDFHDVNNLAFLNSVKRGEVPQELLRAANGREVNLTMEDHRQEDYVPPKPSARPFSGRGQMLGSPAPTTIGSTQPASDNDRKANEAAAQSRINLADSEPTTNITFRLVDGTRLQARFNQSHTVEDLYQYVNTARPQYATTNYVLTYFPNTELTKREMSLKEANVLNTALIQKIK